MIDSILFWNQVALDATKTDFSSAEAAVDPTPQQGGPTGTSRALAIVHLAMYDAYAGITGSGGTYLTYSETPGTSNLLAAQAAVSTAASLTLIALYSRQKNTFLKTHQDFVAALGGMSIEINQGIAWGSLVASQLLGSRKNDGSDASNDLYSPSPEPGRHRPDPVNPAQGFLGPQWGKVMPFGIADLISKVPGTPPPDLNSADYATNYNEVLDKGRDQGGSRAIDETNIGLFWAYDGARNIGVPPRLYNQVVRAIAEQEGNTEAVNARLFAIVNVAMADAGIQTWYEKYLYNFWRPVLGIREADETWGPTGLGDGNPATNIDPYWQPLGSPKTNQPGRSPFTPNFPAYPSGHATFGTAALVATQLVLGLSDDYGFTLVSDELNGESIGARGVRARQDRPFTIASAIEENVLSRVYLGVHWQFDGREGERNGRSIADMICGAFPALA